jgi:hypothetical protein
MTSDTLDKKYDEMQATVNELRKIVEFMHEDPVHEQLKLLKLVRDTTENLSDIKTQLQEMLDKIRQEIIPNTFKDNGITSLTVDGYRYTISQSMRASIKAGVKDAAFTWLRENDLGDLITETVNASTLSATARQMAAEGMELEPDLFNTSYYNNTSITQAK